MNEPRPASALDQALRQNWQDTAEPADDGFSCRVLAAIPLHDAAATTIAPHRSCKRLRWLRWLAISTAAMWAAALLTPTSPYTVPGANAAAAALLGLMIFWTVPSRWHRW